MSLQPLLRQPFARDIYRTILEDILPSGTLQLLQTPQSILATCEFVTATWQIGTIELPDGKTTDGNTIALLEVHVADQIKLARNRVALRNFVARFIDEAHTSAVLAIFHQPGKPDWRLTYACKRSQLDYDTSEITSTQTAPRRYTFLLGSNEICKTAAGRLREIWTAWQDGRQLKLDDVEKAFSVDRLNKDFFKDYKKHYETFTAHLLAPENAKATRTAFGIESHDEKTDQDKADKPIRDFVKRLLGRLVFLHFLQKKGWMGCPAKGKAWSGGDPDFLASYFALAESKKDAQRFHSKWLIPLFFDALNNAERPGALFQPTGTRIPYLNGGLFQTDHSPPHALDFPAEHFRALLEFFGQYHFTIDENDPEDHEVGIDPEMLGHIFENLLEDNKDKGAYYTPKAIVSYMARQSLLHYLQTHLGENAELAQLLNEKDRSRLPNDGFVNKHADDIAELLKRVKICDPAIGSGAFPIGVLQEILWIRLALDWTLNKPSKRAELKREIIQNSIHGVDLDPGAVEIARLRFWLALVVDEDQPRPLPNLDYKIMQGDSLIESFEGIDLSRLHAGTAPGHQSVQLLGSGQTEMLLDDVQAQQELANRQRTDQIAALMDDYFSERNPVRKSARHTDIDRLVLDHLRHCIAYRRDEIEIQLHRRHNETQAKTKLLAAWKPDPRAQKILDTLKAQLAAIKLSGQRLEALQVKHDRPYFLWHLFFQKVFAQGGFDIVIANPPYVQITPERFSTLEIDRMKAAHDFNYKTDLYELFLAHAPKLLNSRGIACYITPITWLVLENSVDLRRNLLHQHGISVIRVWGENVFFSAVVSTQTVFIHRDNPQSRILITPPEGIEFSIAIQDITSQPHSRIDFRRSPIISQVTDKMRRLSQKLESFCEVSQGITPYDKYRGHSSELIKNRGYHSKTKVNNTFGQWLNGKDVSRYKIKWSEEWLSYGDWLGASREEKFFVGPKLLCREVPGAGKRIQAAFHDGIAYCGHAISPLIARPSEVVDLRFILAVLNSAALSWFAGKCSPNFSKDVFPKLNPSDIKDFPIPPASTADKARLSHLAEACAAAAQRGDDATMAVHEAEIDQIVYRLFNLTPDEIALIESALAPTRTTTKRQRKSQA